PGTSRQPPPPARPREFERAEKEKRDDPSGGELQMSDLVVSHPAPREGGSEDETPKSTESDAPRAEIRDNRRERVLDDHEPEERALRRRTQPAQRDVERIRREHRIRVREDVRLRVVERRRPDAGARRHATAQESVAPLEKVVDEPYIPDVLEGGAGEAAGSRLVHQERDGREEHRQAPEIFQESSSHPAARENRAAFT